mmetsp:Transcript_22431/g.32714  ORF Transcript_22431/g.32714 Transcript_22431/m.32714 type:complete len:235 (+) Transcript_22431:35-739(+)
MPEYSDPSLPLNQNVIIEVAKNAAREELQKQQNKEFWVRELDKWDIWSDLMRKCDSRISERVPDMARKVVNEYITSDIPQLLRREMNVYFPSFVANDDAIKAHLQKHIADISALVDRKKEGVIVEIEVCAKQTAERMAKTDQFGMIYDAVSRSANAVVTTEALNARKVVIDQMNMELESTRRERDLLLQELRKTKHHLDSSLNDQKKFKWMAGSGFCMGIISVVGVAFFAINQR